MPNKNTVTKKEVLKDLEKKISPILVVNNSSLKPYVELFDYSPENIYQQPLGDLIGFFEIKEYSEDSAYVVNFLTSVLKKEYYINPKRPVTESLDSALHKVNLALSELAKHGNIQWLGKLNAAICVLEKNNAHFSVAGNAKIFLYRKQGLTDISEDLASDSLEPHPLKTFVNVSSGRLEKDDRLLITSEDIFHIFSELELKKNFQRFEGEKFIQFLKTALSNQMEMIVSIVTELTEGEAPIKEKKAAIKKAVAAENVFSQNAFAATSSAAASKEIAAHAADAVGQIVPDTDYIDKKTGHIYVQGENIAPMENPKFSQFKEAFKEKVGEFWYLTKNESRRRYNLYKKQLAKKIDQRRIEKEQMAKMKEEEFARQLEQEKILEEERQRQLAEQEEAQRILFEQQELERKEAEALESQRLAELEIERQKNEKLKMNDIKVSDVVAENASNEEVEKIEEIVETKKENTKVLSFKEKLQLAMKEQQKNAATVDVKKTQIIEKNDKEDDEDIILDDEIARPVPIYLQKELELKKRQEKIDAAKLAAKHAADKTRQAFISSFATAKKQIKEIKEKNSTEEIKKERPRLTPQFSKMKQLFSSFSAKQKKFAIIALALIFIVPFFVAKFTNKPKKQAASETKEAPVIMTNPLANDKKINLDSKAHTILPKTDLVNTVIVADGTPIVFSKKSVLVKNGNEQFTEHQIPDNNGSIISATYMQDLALVLIATDQNKILSFSPVSFKFTDNNINISGKISDKFIGTYMTYLYVLDPSANQIYRYPRAEGGFGEKTDWLKGQNSFASTSNMTIDDSIYVIIDGKIKKYFKGQEQTFSLENSQTPVSFDKIFTNLDSKSLYVLDNKNSRLISFAKDNGNIVAQFFNDLLKSASSISVDEKNGVAYFITSNGLSSIKLQ